MAAVVTALAIAAAAGSVGHAQDASPRNGKIVFSRYFRDQPDPSPHPLPFYGISSFRLKPIPNFDTDLFLTDRNGTVEQLTARARTEDTHPEWSPDGTKLVFTRRIRKQDTELYVMRADGTHVRRITYNTVWEQEPSWSPDGRRIVFTRWSRDDYRTRIYWMRERRGAKVHRLTNGCGDHAPAWSPDGTQIAFSRSVLDGCSSGNDEIFVMGADGSNVRRFTDNATNDWNPAWSPDGATILFERYDCKVDDSSPDPVGCVVGEDMELHTISADGSDVRTLTDNTDDEYWAAWSPDGLWIVFVRDRDDLGWNPNLYKMRSDGTGIQQLTRGSGIDMHPSWQPLP